MVYAEQRAAKGVCRNHRGQLAVRVPSAGNHSDILGLPPSRKLRRREFIAGLTRVYTEVGMGTATRLLVFVIATAVLVGLPVARAAEEVDLLLVLSADVSDRKSTRLNSSHLG